MVNFKKILILFLVLFVIAVFVSGTAIFFQSTSKSQDTNHIPASESNPDQPAEDLENESETISIDELLSQALESIDYDLLREAIVVVSNAEDASAAAGRDLEIEELRIDPERFERLFSSTLAESIDFLDLQIRFRYSDTFRRVEVRVEVVDETIDETITATKLFQITSA